MADRRFSSKSQSSLARRILFTCMALLVLPLIADSLVVYVHEYQARMRTVYVLLELVSVGQQNLADEMVQDALNQFDFPNPQKGEILAPENQVFASQMQEAVEKGVVTFAALDPKTGQKMIYVAASKDHKTARIIGIPAEDFVHDLIRLPGRPFDFHMAILLSDGSLFISDEPELTLKGVAYFPTPYKDQKFFESLWQNSSKIGIKVPWKSTNLSMAYLVDAKSIRSGSAFTWLSTFLAIFFSIFFLGFVVTYFATRRMGKPLQALCLEMEKVGRGVLTARYISDPFGLEINTLGASFNQMIDSLAKQIEISEKERLAKEALETELKIGQEIQKNLLPAHRVEFPGLEIGAGFQAAQEVAGDFYDLFSAEGKLLVAVGDASGKGISACLYSLGVRSLLRSFYLSHPNNLFEVLKATNAVFCKDTEENQHFVTAWVGIFDPVSKLLEFGSAGHPAAFLKRGDKIEELSTWGIALGALDSESTETQVIQLVSGDILLLYSDGITEAHNSQGEMFGKERVLDFLKTHTAGAIQAIADDLFYEVALFGEGAPQYDDLTLLILRIL